MARVSAVEWRGDRLVLLDQTQLPEAVAFHEYSNWRSVVDAIKTMVVRGAPAIGVAGAFAMALAARELIGDEKWRERLNLIAREVAGARPTAVNLSWAVRRLMEAAAAAPDSGQAFTALLASASAILAADESINAAIADHGVSLVPHDSTVLTICNTGSLAAAGYGTALGIIRRAHELGKNIHVFVSETRPRLQGMRLTAWELANDGISHTIITDNMAGFLMRQGRVQMAVVGADRIAANGDTANKIGTYTIATLCRVHDLPFIIAAPMSTVDHTTTDASAIEIEYRDKSEVLSIGGVRIAPDGTPAINPAFDVTPAEMITAIVTERGVARSPYTTSLAPFEGR